MRNTWETLEGLLIQADLGMETTLDVIDALKLKVREAGLTTTRRIVDGIEG
jgi:signal recognition particle GTPase